MQVGQPYEIRLQVILPDSGAAIARIGIDLIGDGLDGWWVRGSSGLEIVRTVLVMPRRPGPGEWQGLAETVEGCIATTGVKRAVNVEP